MTIDRNITHVVKAIAYHYVLRSEKKRWTDIMKLVDQDLIWTGWGSEVDWKGISSVLCGSPKEDRYPECPGPGCEVDWTKEMAGGRRERPRARSSIGSLRSGRRRVPGVRWISPVHVRWTGKYS